MTRIYPFQTTARWLALGFLAVALLLGGWATTWAQEEPEKDKLKIQTERGELKNIQTLEGDFPELKVIRKTPEDEDKVAVLSPHHAMLHKLVGHWTAQARVQTEPGAEPVDSRGEVHNELILGGRALQTQYKGELMGEAFVGLGFDGYDMDKGHHFSIWMDTTNTGATYDSGDCNHDGMDVVTLHGRFNDPRTGEQVERKTILTLRSTSRYTYEEWHTRAEGEPTLAMQVIFSKNN